MPKEGKNKTGKAIFSWETGEGKKDSASVLWVAGVFVLIIAALIYAFFTKEWLMGMVFVILVITFAWYLFSQQKGAKISLTNKGIFIDRQFYGFDKIKGYWASEANKTIYLVPRFKLAPPIAIPAGKYKTADIIKMLPSSLTKVEREGADLIDRIGGMLKK